MQRRDFLKSATALAALVALREEAIAAPGEIPRRTLGRTGETVSIVGLGGFHIGTPSAADEDSIRIIRAAIDARRSTSSTTAGTTTTARARCAWARALPATATAEGLPDDQDRRPHRKTPRRSRSTNRCSACRPTTSTSCRSTRSSASTIPTASSPRAARSRRSLAGARRPARSATSASPATRTPTIHLHMLEVADRARLHLRHRADAAQRDGRPLPQLRPQGPAASRASTTSACSGMKPMGSGVILEEQGRRPRSSACTTP